MYIMYANASNITPPYTHIGLYGVWKFHPFGIDQEQNFGALGFYTRLWVQGMTIWNGGHVASHFFCNFLQSLLKEILLVVSKTNHQAWV